MLETCNFGPIDTGPLAEAVAEVYLGDKMGPKAPRPVAQRPADSSLTTGAAGDLASLAGDYYSEEVDATYRVAWRDGRLSYSAYRIPTQVLTPVGPDTFRAADGLTVRFERSAPGAPATGFTIGGGRAVGFTFKRR